MNFEDAANESSAINSHSTHAMVKREHNVQCLIFNETELKLIALVRTLSMCIVLKRSFQLEYFLPFSCSFVCVFDVNQPCGMDDFSSTFPWIRCTVLIILIQ